MKIKCILCKKETDLPDSVIEELMQSFDYENVESMNFSCNECCTGKLFDVLDALAQKVIFHNAKLN